MKNLLWVDFYENMPFFSRKSLGVTFLLFFTVFFSRLIISVSEMYYIYLTLAVVLFAILTSIADHYTQFEKIKKEIDTAKKEDRKIDLNQMVLSEEMSVLANELSQLSNSYETALLDQMRAERLKTDLITNVSHDIKTPLTSIINYVDLLKKLDIDHNQLKEFTSILENKSQRLKNLVDDLLEASKASSGSIEMKIESINIVELAGQIAGEFDESFLQNNLTLIENYPDQAFIFADSRYLWRVVENIFGNTAKYAMPDTRVYSQIMNQNGNVIFTLKNVSKIALNISADELTEQFIRGDRSRSTEGSGLGLYIAKSLIENMNGKIDVLINGDLFEVKITLPIVTEK
jgi:signal transduction histidine kinase